MAVIDQLNLTPIKGKGARETACIEVNNRPTSILRTIVDCFAYSLGMTFYKCFYKYAAAKAEQIYHI